MHPILFHIPFFGWPIYSYGLMMVVGFLVAIQLGKYLAKRYGIDPEVFVNAGLLALVAGVVGARLSHVLENFSQYTNPARGFFGNLWDAINIHQGGLTYYGGFLLAFPVLTIYAIKKKIPVRLGMDIIAPCLMIGLGFGRIGCFLNGCCYGGVCELPWAVSYPYDSVPYQDEVACGTTTPPEELQSDSGTRRAVISRASLRGSPHLEELAASEQSQPRHPAQLYSALMAFLIAALSLAFFTLPHVAGRAFALMMMAEGLSRYLLELLRVEPPVTRIAGHGLSLSMLIGLGLLALGVALWIGFGMFNRPAKAQLVTA